MNTAGLSFLGSKAKPTAEAIARWCEGEGVGLEFDKRGGHPCAILTLNRQTRKVFFSSTPSDWRDAENSLVNIKKAARELGWEPRKEIPMETPVLKSLADLPKLAEPEPHSVIIKHQHPAKVPQPPEQFFRKPLPGGRHGIPQLTKAIRARNEWVFQQKEKGRTDDAIWRELLTAGWLIKGAGNVSGMVSQHRKAIESPVADKAPRHEPEVQHRAPAAPAATIDPLVLAIAEAIAPLVRDQLAKQSKALEALKAKADKWDAISGLVRDA